MDTPKTEVTSNEQPHIDMVAVYQTLLRVVAQWSKRGYTEDSLRQAVVQEHDDLPNPPSDSGARQG